MSGLPWFELDVDMPDDPKCDALAARLREPLAFGYVVRLYAHCYRHGTDRFAGESASFTVEKATRWQGKKGELVAALFAEGFLERSAGAIVVHGIERRLGPHLAAREKAAHRQRRARDKASKRVAGDAYSGAPVTRDEERDVTRDGFPDEQPDEASADPMTRCVGGVDAAPVVEGQGEKNRPLGRNVTRDVTRESRCNTDTDTDIDIESIDSSRAAVASSPANRVRAAVSFALGVVGPGGQGLALPASRKLGAVIRDTNAAVERLGFEQVVDVLVTKGREAKARGDIPETFGFFARTLHDLACPANGVGSYPSQVKAEPRRILT